MRFNLVSNINNGVGLQRDYELLRHQLQIRGHMVQGVQFNAKPPKAHKADINVFLEVVNPVFFAAAPKQWAVPNPEWWFKEWDQYPWDLILAKTRDCERIFREKFGDKCQFLGWLARDLYDAKVPKERKFLHVAGKSQFKNTPAVVAGCLHAKVPLTLIGEHFGTRRRVNEQELVSLMNSHFCHVMPSAYEGYGQVLHEARGVGQIIVTTDAPPMNELVPAMLVPSESTWKYHEGTLHKVSAMAVSRVVQQVKALSPTVVKMYAEHARFQYEQEKQAFQEALDELVGRG